MSIVSAGGRRSISPQAAKTATDTAERALRGVAIGRKNYLHVGSDAGGHTAAVMYTLMGTAKLNGINPHRYLRHVLERIGDHPSNRPRPVTPCAPMRRIWQRR